MATSAFQVRTRYTGATDTKGSRITAMTHSTQLTVPYDYAASDPHVSAVQALLRSMGYPERGAMIELAKETATGYVYNILA